MQPEIRFMAPMRTFCIERKGFADGNFTKAAGEAFGAAFAYVGRNNLFGRLGPPMGVIASEMIGPESEWAYQVQFPVLDEDPIPADPDVHEERLEMGRVAVFQHFGSYDKLSATWGRVYHEWFPASGLTARSDAPVLEIYLGDPDTTPEPELLTEIVLPIE